MSQNLKQQTIDTYNDTAELMAEKFNAMGARVEDIKRAFSFVREKPRILEIGCGNGRAAKEIVARTKTYLGLDISQGLIDLARRDNPDVSFVVSDLEEFEFAGQWDVVFAFASLIHTPREKMPLVLSRIYDALDDEGVLYVSMKSAARYGEFTRTDRFGTRTYYHYTAKDFCALAGDDWQILYDDTQYVLDQDWFTIALKKT